MKHIIDIETWERRGNYDFFRSHANSWYSVTTEIDCTESYASAKTAGRSFFLTYLYAVLRAVNEVKEFRYRTQQGRVVLYDTVDIITPVAVPGGTFHTVRIPYQEDFGRFYDRAQRLIADLPEDGNPYGVEKELFAAGEYDIVHLSAVPQLYFTSITYTAYRVGEGCTHPLMTAGKAVRRADRLVMPFSVYVNHAFVDGEHLALLFEKIQDRLK